MVGQHSKRDIHLILLAIFFTCDAGSLIDDRHHEIGVVIGGAALNDSGQPFQAHPRIDTGIGKRSEFAGFIPIVLHENQIPDFQESVAIATDFAGRLSTTYRFTLVNKYFRAGAAGAGGTHGPEVILFSHLVYPLARHFHLIGPQVEGLVIIFEDRNI